VFTVKFTKTFIALPNVIISLIGWSIISNSNEIPEVYAEVSKVSLNNFTMDITISTNTKIILTVQYLALEKSLYRYQNFNTTKKIAINLASNSVFPWTKEDLFT
jgi:hypothetical protein